MNLRKDHYRFAPRKLVSGSGTGPRGESRGSRPTAGRGEGARWARTSSPVGPSGNRLCIFVGVPVPDRLASGESNRGGGLRPPPSARGLKNRPERGFLSEALPARPPPPGGQTHLERRGPETARVPDGRPDAILSFTLMSRCALRDPSRAPRRPSVARASRLYRRPQGRE